MQLATNVAGDSSRSVLVDAEATAETAFPHALRFVIDKIVKSGRGLEDLMRVHSIEIYGNAPDGQGTMPDGIYKQFLDRAYLPEVKFGSMSSMPDYGRFRFDNQMCYFVIEDGVIHYSCDTRPIRRRDESGGITLGDSVLAIESQSLTSADVGKRVRFVKTDGTLVIDAFLDSVTSGGVGVLRGNALAQADQFIPEIVIYEDPPTEILDRTILDLTTELNNDVITSAGLIPVFSAADEGRRLKAGVYPLNAVGRLTVVDGTNVFATGYMTVSVPSGYSTGTYTITQGKASTGAFGVSASLPQAGDSIVVGGATFLFYNADPTDLTYPLGYIPIRTTRTAQATSIAQALTAYANAYPASNVAKCTYTSQATVALITYKTLGTIGDTFTTAANASGRVTALGATLSGGVDGIQAGEIIYVNGFKCVWSDGPTDDVVYIGLPEDSAEENAALFCSVMNSVANATIRKATFSQTGDGTSILATHVLPGAVGNLYETASSSNGAMTAAQSNLSGGTGGIIEGETFNIGRTGGLTFICSNAVASTPTNLYVPFSATGDAEESAELIRKALNTKTDVKVSVATYSNVLPPGPETEGETLRSIKIVYDTPGTTGNTYALNNSSGTGITRSGATLTGGVSGNITSGEKITIQALEFEYNNTPASDHIPFDVGGNRFTNATLMAAHLTSVTGIYPEIGEAIYTVDGADVIVTSNTPGVAGEAFTIGDSTQGHVTASGSHLVLEESRMVVDTFIEEYIDAYSVRLRAFPLSAEALCDAEILKAPLKLTAVAQPDLSVSADTDLGLPSRITDEVAATIASVMRGEIKLQDLMREL